MITFKVQMKKQKSKKRMKKRLRKAIKQIAFGIEAEMIAMMAKPAKRGRVYHVEDGLIN